MTPVFLALRTSPLVFVAMVGLLVRARVAGEPWAFLDTALVTYLMLALFADLATALGLRSHGWLLKWRAAWWGLGFEVYPRSTVELTQAMRGVGLASLSVPLVVSVLSGVWFATGQANWFSHSAAVWLTSTFMTVTALLPSLPRAASAGSVGDRLRRPRWARANWVWAAVVGGLDSGATLSELVLRAQLEPLLPQPAHPVEPVTLLFQTLCCERGEFELARPLLPLWLAQRDSLPAWLAVDGLKHAGAVWALVDGELAKASECLEHLVRLQLVPWYAELLNACIAHARQDPTEKARALNAWREAVSTHPRRALLLGANRWVLRRLEAETASPLGSP